MLHTKFQGNQFSGSGNENFQRFLLGSQMLHTKFQGNQFSGSGNENFQRFLLYMGMAAILVIIMRPGPDIQTLFPL